ncbi:MAG: hypothetical protein ING51_13410 [Rhodocyclaceae bacterium]|nr:hypothetical protein [Rhodocyclaceae bacterium]
MEERTKFFNLYVKAVALQVTWGIGERVARFETLTFNRLFGIEEAVLVTDKATDTYSKIRCVPVSDAIRKTLLHFLEHMRSHADWLEKNGQQKCAQHLRKIASGERQTLGAFELLYAAEDGQLCTRALTVNDVRELANAVWPGELNRPRHFFVNEFVSRRVAQVAIDAFTGRHCRGAAPFGLGSGLSVAQYVLYLREIINQVHKDLKITPLVGFGRTAERFLVMPIVAIRPNLEPLSNQFLMDRIEADDSLSPDVVHPADGCPFDSDTLLAVGKVRYLRRQYLRSSVAGKYPAGALLFCLAFFDGVSTPHELRAYFSAITEGQAHDIGGPVVVELEKDGSVFSQRLISRSTILAAGLHTSATTRCSLAEAESELRLLLAELDSGWRSAQNRRAMELVSALVSHSLTYEVPQHLQVAVHHKAPILNKENLARILQGAPNLADAVISKRRPASHGRSKDFETVLQVARHWANEENRLGEQQARKAGLVRDLKVLIDCQSFDEAEALLAEWIIAECATKPLGNRLKIQTILRYAIFSKRFFRRVRFEGGTDFDFDTWREIIEDLEKGEGDNKEEAGWVMTHVATFLNYIGKAVPVKLIGKNSPTPRAPRAPVYVAEKELQLICEHLKQERGDSNPSETEQLLLRFMRKAPVRPCEVLFAKLNHVNPDAGVFAVTTGGHAHLKYDSTRGLVGIPAELRAEFTHLVARRKSFGAAQDVPLFGNHSTDQETSFQDFSEAIVAATRYVTGRNDFRFYDLRANAVTDLIAAPGPILARLSTAVTTRQHMTDSDIATEHSRVALAARQARHTIFAALRSYAASGFLELAEHLRYQTSDIEASSAFVAAMCRSTISVIDKRASKAREGGQFQSARSQILFDQAAIVATTFAKVVLADTAAPPPISSIPAAHTQHERLVRAGLLVEYGHGNRAAAEHQSIQSELVSVLIRQVELLKKTIGLVQKKAPPAAVNLIRNDTLLSQLIQDVPTWLTSKPDAVQLLRRGLLSTVAKPQSQLTVPDFDVLKSWLPWLKSLPEIGVQVFLQPNSLLLSPELAHLLRANCVAVTSHASKSGGVGALKFGPREDRDEHLLTRTEIQLPSTQVTGRVGRLLIQGFILLEAARCQTLTKEMKNV